jgi:hypothetical protein
VSYPVKIGAARTGAGGCGATGFGGAFFVVGGAFFVVVVFGTVVVVGAAVVVVVFGTVVVVVGAVVVVVGAVVVVVVVVVVGAVVVVVVGAVVVVVLVVVVGAVVVVVDVDVVVTGGGGKQNEMWLMPLPSGASSPVLSEVTGGSYVYTFAVGPPLTMTWLTGVFEVQVNSIGSGGSSSLTSVTVIVTDRAPWVNVLDSPTPRSSKSSAWIVNVVVPAGHSGLPSSSSTVRTAWAGLETTTATSSPAATASAAAAAIVTIHRPEKRDPRVLRPIPSPCVVRPTAQARGMGFGAP